MNYKIKFNKKLFWDYKIPENIKDETILIFCISKTLNNGTFDDVKAIPLKLIEKYINKLSLSKKIMNFWKWYLN